MARILVVALGAWLGALALTPLVRRWAVHHNYVCHPRADRWSTRPVALLGGVGIVAAFLVGALPALPELSSRELALIGLSLVMFVVGVIDDRLHLKPHTKLLAQLIAAVGLVESGFRFGLPDSWYLADKALSLLWVVGISNALNLLDNMDGLCAGIAAIAAGFLVLLEYQTHYSAALLAAAVAGACLGYLRYNQHPASIFMGDGGSLFLGFFLGGAVLLGPGPGTGRSLLSVLALPALLLLAPLLDTMLVTIARKWARRPISQGGRDHTSHRLVAIGLSEPQAVRLLYVLGTAGGLSALAVSWLDWYVSTLLLPLLLFGVGLLGCYLGRVRVYDDGASLSDLLDSTPLPLIAQHRYRRRLVEVLIDTAAIVAAFYIANALRYEDSLALLPHWTAFLTALPVVIVAHLVAYFVVGVYRGMWRYTSVSDLPRFACAVALGLLLTIAWLALTGRLELLGEGVLGINAMAQLGFLASTRVSVKLLRDHILAARPGGDAQRVLLVGIGEEAEIGLRCLRRDRALYLLGAVCEDTAAIGLRLLDTPVLGTSADVDDLLRSLGVQQVVLLDTNYPADGWRQIQEACAVHSVQTRVVKVQIEPAVAN
ncbi:MAG: hypothetical protein IT204_18025 [Fimbriimonadaceae bacterium]|nr:hypothetical protein [Fimbriimonadaceae bacterium]